MSLKKPSQYCTEAIETLIQYETNLRTHRYDPNKIELANTMKSLISDIDESVKFRLPLNGTLIGDFIAGKEFKEIIVEHLGFYRMPFSSVTLEFEADCIKGKSEQYVEGLNEYCACVIHIKEELREGTNPIFQFHILNKVRLEGEKRWIWSPIPYHLTLDLERIKLENGILGCLGIIPFIEDIPFSKDSIYTDTIHEIEAIITFLLALNCSNVSMQKSFPPSLTENKKRQKKGLPLYNQYQEIIVDISHRGVIAHTQKMGEGAKKATHIRRGHIRRYEHKSIWIEQTIINAQSKETLKPKNYRLRK